MERTLILVKPDAFTRGLAGEIISRFERKGLRAVALKELIATRETAETHYEEHVEQPFYANLVDFLISGPLVTLILEGEQAIDAARQLIGATDPLKATPGTIRGDYAIAMARNVVHGSDSEESAVREIALWFPELP